ncbi:hypothetical protein A8B78_19655 [Jannaschia sp. EhC01]|nr:hypothetical protein A8B78_19655 [Jannaschia sp. EhC01]
MNPFVRRVSAEVDGRRIEVINHWFKGCAVQVDGVEVAQSDQKLSLTEEHPLIEVTVDGPSGPLNIDVRILAILFVQIELRVNGRYVAGSRLVKEQEQ